MEIVVDGDISIIIMDTAKTFDAINHDFLQAKLRAHEFSTPASSLICSYLNDRKQRVQINNKFCSFKEVLGGVSQGDKPLGFNLFINCFFVFLHFSA